MSMSTQIGSAEDSTTTSATQSVPGPDLDLARVEVFAGRVLGVVSDAATALTLSIGHRTGLFDTMAGLPPSTSEEIARPVPCTSGTSGSGWPRCSSAASCEHDPAAGTWSLPPEHGAVLTRAAGKDNLAKLAQFVGLLAGVEHDVVTCFREGGGVPYSAYPEFHALMSEDSRDMAEGLLVSTVMPLVDGLSDRLASRYPRRRHRLRQRPPPQRPCQHLPGELVRRLRLLRGGDRAGTCRTPQAREPHQCPLRSAATSRTCPAPARSTSSPPSTPSTTRPTRQPCSRASPTSLTPDGVFLMVDIRASSQPHENVGMLPARRSCTASHSCTA